MTKPTTTTAPTGAVAPFGLRMLGELRSKIEDAARASGRSMNAEIVARLEASFAEAISPDTRLLLDKAELSAAEAAMENYRLRTRIAEMALALEGTSLRLLTPGASEDIEEIKAAASAIKDARLALADALDGMGDPAPIIRRLIDANDRMREHAARLGVLDATKVSVPSSGP